MNRKNLQNILLYINIKTENVYYEEYQDKSQDRKRKMNFTLSIAFNTILNAFIQRALKVQVS